MALPITVKPWETQSLVTQDAWGQTWPVYSKRIRRRIQEEPIDRPLEYDMIEKSVMMRTSAYNSAGPQIDKTETFLYADREYSAAVAYNRAYAKFLNEVLQTGDQGRTEVGMNVATAHMTADLLKDSRLRVGKIVSIAGLASLLNQFAELIRRNQHKKAVKLLGKRMPPSVTAQLKANARRGKFRDFGRDISQEYIMLHFAWSPLLGDMYGLLQQIATSFTEAPITIKVKGGARFSRFVSTGDPPLRTVTRGNGWHSATMGCEAQVTNVPLFVLNRAGLVNPLTVAWDLVPFSFVLDWFANFSAQLAAPTDFVGVTLKGFYHSLFTKAECVHTSWVKNQFTDNRVMAYEQVGHDTYFWRKTPSMPPAPRLIAKMPIGHWRRSLVQISLLTTLGIKPGGRRPKA